MPRSSGMEQEIAPSPDAVRRELTEALERTEMLRHEIAAHLADAEREIEEIKRAGIPPRG